MAGVARVNIKAVRRGNSTLRYHTTGRIRPETVGQHSANVAALCYRLYPECSRDLLLAALSHDWAEAYTGDVPAPAKWDSPALKSALEVAEQEYCEVNGINLPLHSEYELLILKLADIMDLVMSSMEEMNMGNTEAQWPYENGYTVMMDRAEELQLTDLVKAILLENEAAWQPTINK